MSRCIIQLILTAVIVAGYCSAQAPEDGDERCTGAEDAPTYPDAVKNLMDSYNYVQLLPGSGTGNPPIEGAVWTDRSVDDNNTIDTTSPTYWQHGGGGICRFQVRVCGYSVRRGQDNWLFTQYISQSFDPNNYTYPVEIQVELVYALSSCRDRFGCKPKFELYYYATNTTQLPITTGSGFMNTHNYVRFKVVKPPDTIRTFTKTFTFTLQPNVTGFYFAIRDNGTCVGISRVRVFRNNCQSFQSGLVIYPDTPAHISSNVSVPIQCVPGSSRVPNNDSVTCRSDGTWVSGYPACECHLGYEDRETECFKCPAGKYRSAIDTTCQPCPDNTVMDRGCVAICECLDGFFRNDENRINDSNAQSFVRDSDEPPSTKCSQPPSAPQDLTVVPEQTSIVVRWSSPASTGGRSDLYYQVEHSDPDILGTYTGTVYLSGGSTSHSFTGLRAYTQYCIRVIAHNGVSDQDPDGTHLRTVEECTRTPEDIPGPVDGVEGHCSVVVWSVPKEPNGEILSYTLLFISNAGDDSELEIETNNDQTRFVIRPESGLQTLLEIGSVFVKVRATNGAGTGDFSQVYYIGCEDPFVNLGSGATPSPPVTIPEPVETIFEEGDVVYWDKPQGRISYYVVRYFNEQGDELLVQETKEPHIVLSKDLVGNFSVQVCSVLDGVQSNCSMTLKLFRKDPTIPLPQVTGVSVDGSTLFWEKPAGSVSYYVVILSSKNNEQVVVETAEQYYKIPEGQKEYSVQVCAVVDGVRGPCSTEEDLSVLIPDSEEVEETKEEEGVSQELIIAATASAGGTAIVVGTLCLCFAALHHWRFKKRFGPNKEALTWEDYKIKT